MSRFWICACIAALLGLASASPSVAGGRVHVWADSAAQIAALRAENAQFFGGLASAGYEIDFVAVRGSSDAAVLMRFEERVCDHLYFFAHKASIDADVVLSFVKAGGNVVLAAEGASLQASSSLRAIVHELGAAVDKNGNSVADPIHSAAANAANNGTSAILSRNLLAGASPVLPRRAQYASAPLRFGPALAHTVKLTNPLIQKVLAAESSALTLRAGESAREATGGKRFALGGDITLVSAMQTKNNARIAIVGDASLFSDAVFKLSEGNRLFIEDVTRWTMQESGVLRVAGKRLHKVGETELRDGYRIKDQMSYELELESWDAAARAWTPHTAADLQLELVMLDPYVRQTFASSQGAGAASGLPAGLHRLRFQLPDVYGVFKFRVEHRRFGLTFLEELDVLPIRPFRHDEYPRFLFAALPYYIAAWSMLLGTGVVAYVWLFVAPEKKSN